MESALRADHEASLAGSARAIAQVLTERPGLLPAADPDEAADVVYAHPLRAPILLDGYADDWGEVQDRQRDHVPGAGRSTSLHLRAVAGQDARYVYLFLRVDDDAVVWLDPARGPVHDYALLRMTTPAGELVDLIVESAAPGPVQARRRGGSADPNLPPVLGNWQSGAAGYQIELRLPRALIGERLGYAVVDGDGTPLDPPLHAGTVSPSGRAVGPLVAPSPGLSRALGELVAPGKRLQVSSPQRWPLGEAGVLVAGDAPGEAPAALTRVYRWILDPELPQRRRRDAQGRLDGPDIDRALRGESATLWYRTAAADDAVIAASAPVLRDGRVVAVVTLEQQSAAILTLTHSALTRLVNLTVLATATAAVGLLGFATWLSLRIRRLRNAADSALASDGSIRARIPGLAARDEIGDLSRSFAGLLEQLREHTDYLRSLAGKLAHELRTPLAVVQSSLENLSATTLTDDARVYAERASDGAQRLGSILVAMSEATRVEQAISNAEPERFDLDAMLRGAVQGYQDTYPERVFRYAPKSEPCEFLGVPELLLQMLDKLVENAVDFTPTGGTIGFDLVRLERGWRLTVTNEGSSLPPSMQGSLFDSLVSVREARGGRTHLGFGLFIAKLIVQFHEGRISASNVPGGVAFVIELPHTAHPG